MLVKSVIKEKGLERKENGKSGYYKLKALKVMNVKSKVKLYFYGVNRR